MTQPALFDTRVTPARSLTEGREALDAYWTPAACAQACMEAIADHVLVPRTPSVLEPAVGGGAWASAARWVWSGATVTRMDIDADVPGLRGEGRAIVGDFLTHDFDVPHFDAVVGNPPYGGDILAWLDRSLALAPVVAYLLRGTIQGSLGRLPWWEAHLPARVWTLAPRPSWEGPGARRETDTVDSVLVLWVRGEAGATWRPLGWRR